MGTILGGKIAAQALIEHRVDVIFTLSGGHITPIYQFLEDSPIQLFDTRHEQAAVFMAEAYGRMTRKPGVAMVTAGPGFTNALSAVANANQANSPMLLIAGSVGVSCCEKWDLQDMRQAPVIEPMVKKAFVCHTPSRIGEFVDMAYRAASCGRPGPVYLELPVDMLNAQVEEAKAKQMNTQICSSHPVDLAKAAQLVDMLKQAKKPMVIAGSGAWYSDSSEQLTAFADKCGVPVFTSSMGRGVISDTHPYCFESAVGTRPGSILYAQADADLVIFLGVRLSLYFMFGEVIDNNAKIAQIDISPEELGRNRPVDLPVCSDARGFLTEVNRLVDEQGAGDDLKKQYADWVDLLRTNDAGSKTMMQPTWESADTPIHPLRLMNEINKFMDRDDDIVVGDGGDTQIWMSMTRTIKQGGHYLDSGLYGCLGVGLPFAQAAKFLNPDKRVLCVIGDGSVGFNFMEFETSIRKNNPFVVIVSNDLGWGMIRHSQTLRLGHNIENGTEIGYVPYHKLVEDLGGFGIEVDKPEDIAPAIEKAFASGKTACVNVMTDPSTISPGSIALASIGAYK